MADTTAWLAIDVWPVGVHDQLTFTIQKSEKRNGRRRRAQTDEQSIRPRRISLFCSGLLLHAEMDDHEVLINDGFDGIGLDETIEFMAPPSPRGMKNGEDGSLSGHLSLRGIQERGGRGWRLRVS